jgi:toxin ParE1/3/4
VKYRVTYEPEALNDLLDLYDYIAEHSDLRTALRYVERIEASCEALSTFPLRGSSVGELRKGLRIVGFERKVNIAFAVDKTTVKIIRVLPGGRQFPGLSF